MITGIDKLPTSNVARCAAVAAGVPGGQGDLELVEVGVRCSLEQMLEEGFYHSDPHPGNLLHTDGGELAYIDFGGAITAPRPRSASAFSATAAAVLQ